MLLSSCVKEASRCVKVQDSGESVIHTQLDWLHEWSTLILLTHKQHNLAQKLNLKQQMELLPEPQNTPCLPLWYTHTQTHTHRWWEKPPLSSFLYNRALWEGSKKQLPFILTSSLPPSSSSLLLGTELVNNCPKISHHLRRRYPHCSGLEIVFELKRWKVRFFSEESSLGFTALLPCILYPKKFIAFALLHFIDGNTSRHEGMVSLWPHTLP